MFNKHLISYKKIKKFVSEVNQRKKNRMFYVGGYPAIDNLGDVALYEAFSKILFSENEFVHFTGGRLITKAVSSFGLSGVGLLSGGTLINRLSLSTALDSMKVMNKLFVFGTGGAQPEFWNQVPEFKDSMESWKVFLEQCQYIGVRGPLTQKLLQDQGISNVDIVGDPVLAYAKELNPLELKFEAKTIGLNIGVSKGHVWGSEKQICIEFTKLAKDIKKAGFKVHWFIVTPDDLEITLQAAKESDTEEFLHKTYTNCEEYYELVSKMSVFAGIKLHAVVMAMCEYVPSLMIEYRPKCRDFMLSVDQGHNNIRADKFFAKNVIDTLIDWNLNRNQQAEKLYNSMRPLCNKQKEKALYVKSEIIQATSGG